MAGAWILTEISPAEAQRYGAKQNKRVLICVAGDKRNLRHASSARDATVLGTVVGTSAEHTQETLLKRVGRLLGMVLEKITNASTTVI